MKEHHKDAIQSYYFDEERIKKISEDLEIPQGTVKSRLSRARKSARKRIDAIEEFEDETIKDWD